MSRQQLFCEFPRLMNDSLFRIIDPRSSGDIIPNSSFSLAGPLIPMSASILPASDRRFRGHHTDLRGRMERTV